jgi:phage host-nuclease inhibitor protein Gam
MARHKPTPVIVSTREEATAVVGEIAELDRELARIETDMKEEIDAAKARALQRASNLQARRKELKDGVCVYATLNRADLFKNAKTLDLGYGKIGFRASTAIVQERGVTAEMTLLKLRELGLTDGIRTKEELNKENLLAWPDERLALVGVRRQKRDAFFIDIPPENLPEA